MFTKTCLDLWREESKQLGIVTFCRDLDQAIGNGISVGMITELCGPPGSGKTQMCLQLCINTQIPVQLGGLGAKAIYFDTNFGFHPCRLQEIASACVTHCQKLVQIHKKELATVTRDFTVDSLMNGVYYKHIQSCSELLEGIETLGSLLKSGDKIKLVVLDSVSFLIRNNIENSFERIEVDHVILTKLHVLAHQYKCAIVITNDVTTRINGQDSKIVPALGDAHSHKINQRIVLGQSDEDPAGVHIASVEKGLFRTRMAVKFQISQAGIRGVRKK
ncbi:AAEL011307-PA [Aedes aegypti]|uniref:DNA repair protein RAD51 homolog 3 n=2 Tax=Aedes aegypti TaxID=7159 RepID=A0A1S4FT66_AEDAE|nr:DNA repair protein RAD51 homolog 3 [Aedes aegypti]EAT36631.1 AAEL011307-PA [Aedes aegypti]